MPPRSSIGVSLDAGGQLLEISFIYGSGGRAEMVSIAEAEALAERLLDWVDVVRFEQLVGKAQSR